MMKNNSKLYMYSSSIHQFLLGLWKIQVTFFLCLINTSLVVPILMPSSKISAQMNYCTEYEIISYLTKELSLLTKLSFTCLNTFQMLLPPINSLFLLLICNYDFILIFIAFHHPHDQPIRLTHEIEEHSTVLWISVNEKITVSLTIKLNLKNIYS